MLRLIQKWLKVGVLEDGVRTVSERGTGQGSVISPLLANVYLHYVFDLWAERWRHREAVGTVIISSASGGQFCNRSARMFFFRPRGRAREGRRVGSAAFSKVSGGGCRDKSVHMALNGRD
jgi:retron-type reverse transcriptase